MHSFLRTDAPEDIPLRWNEQWRKRLLGLRQQKVQIASPAKCETGCRYPSQGVSQREAERHESPGLARPSSVVCSGLEWVPDRTDRGWRIHPDGSILRDDGFSARSASVVLPRPRPYKLAVLDIAAPLLLLVPIEPSREPSQYRKFLCLVSCLGPSTKGRLSSCCSIGAASGLRKRHG